MMVGCKARRWKKNAPLAVLLVTLVLGAAWVLAVESGTVEGTLTVDGEATTLTNAYAHQRMGHFDPSKLDAVVILCDKELTEAAVMDQNERLKMEKAGPFHALELSISHEGKLTSVKVRHPVYDWGPSGNSTRYKLTLDRYDETGVAGKITCDGERITKGHAFTFAATFAVEYTKPAE
ncbi:MAG: hypothetical protein JXQ27_17065 [Acidobacteria bacterium]|nr:hypothetical protein [Acidobacteriota bacterium]